MRVGLIGPVPPDLGGATPGGVATHQVHLADALAAAGLDVRLLATNALAPSQTQWEGAAGAVRLYRMCEPSASAGWLRAVGVGPLLRYAAGGAVGGLGGSRRVALGHLLWYRRFVMVARPEILHVQHPMERQLYARQVLRLERRRLPLVVTLHSFFGEHADATIHGLMAPNLRHADRLIAVSPHVADQAAALGANPDRLRVIRSGVDVQAYRPRDPAAARRRLGVDPSLSLVLFVGNLEPRKGVDRLVAAMALVCQAIPEAVLAIIGTGDSAGAQNQTPLLHRLVREHGLLSSVRFLGRVDASTLRAWYAAADVFALPSSSEAQGIAALEAMASGLPVVASAVGGLLGTIEDGRTGFLVPAGDVTTLAQRLVQLLGDPARRRAMGIEARASVERAFSWQRTAAATIEVYREALAASCLGEKAPSA